MVHHLYPMIQSLMLSQSLPAITQASVHLQLAAEEANSSGTLVPIHFEITPDVLIATRIDLEEQQ